MAILRILIFKALLFLAWPSYTQASVLKHESSKLKTFDFSFSEFCETMKAKSTALVSVLPQGEMECFTEKFSIIDFCLKKFPTDKHITRGYAVEKEKKIYCEEAQSVMISIGCDERDMHYCFDPKKGCEKLKKIYAHRLEIVHYSMLEKNLNCYFSRPLGDSLDEK